MRFSYEILEWAAENEMETEIFVLSILSLIILILTSTNVDEDNNK